MFPQKEKATTLLFVVPLLFVVCLHYVKTNPFPQSVAETACDFFWSIGSVILMHEKFSSQIRSRKVLILYLQVCVTFFELNIIRYIPTLHWQMDYLKVKMIILADSFVLAHNKLTFNALIKLNFILLHETHKHSLILLYNHMKWFSKTNSVCLQIFLQKSHVINANFVLVNFVTIYQLAFTILYQIKLQLINLSQPKL